MYKDYWESKYKKLGSGNAGYLIDDQYIANCREKKETQYLKSFVGRYSRGSSLALDVGCGEGRVASCMSASFSNVTAIDLSENVINNNVDVYSSKNNITWLSSDIESFCKQTDLRFDFIYVGGVFGYIDDLILEETIDSLKKVLSESGIIVLREIEYKNNDKKSDTDNSVIIRRECLFYERFGFEFLKKNIAYELAPTFYFFTKKLKVNRAVSRKAALVFHSFFSFARAMFKRKPYRVCNYYIYSRVSR